MTGIRPNFDPSHLYFVTISAVAHAHIFQRDVIKRILADSLHYMCASQWISLYCFVVMPNHIHFIARFQETHPVKDVIREFKKHTSKQVIRQYQAEDNQATLSYLAKAAERIKDQQHKVWEDGYDARDVFTPDFLRQKMEYIHNNPCQPHWRLVEQPEDYPWSSARFYLLAKPTIIAVDDVRDLLV